ncbi:MAG: glycosyltransferase family 2 protein [Ekhidna sp.]|nr:glycosyltransferase family 2 protein [Ekhidna sp.]
MEKTKISVILPTYNRLKLLSKQLDALLKQSISSQVYEILVSNDGSTDGTGEFLDFMSLHHENLRVFHGANGGPARARNIALRHAQGEIIAFTDDDCEVHPDWLATILNEFNHRNLVGLQGFTYTNQKEVTPLTHQIDNESGHNSIPTCNAAYLKKHLVELGGFDETFPFPHNEDADIGWQMQEIGEVSFCPAMKVYHPPRKDKFYKVAQRMKILKSEFTLYKKNPKLYKKYRDRNPIRHIYYQVFIKVMWYYTYSRLKYWRKPKLIIQGFALTFYWFFDLIRKYPSYRSIYKNIKSTI